MKSFETPYWKLVFKRLSETFNYPYLEPSVPLNIGNLKDLQFPIYDRSFGLIQPENIGMHDFIMFYLYAEQFYSEELELYNIEKLAEDDLRIKTGRDLLWWRDEAPEYWLSLGGKAFISGINNRSVWTYNSKSLNKNEIEIFKSCGYIIEYISNEK